MKSGYLSIQYTGLGSNGTSNRLKDSQAFLTLPTLTTLITYSLIIPILDNRRIQTNKMCLFWGISIVYKLDSIWIVLKYRETLMSFVDVHPIFTNTTCSIIAHKVCFVERIMARIVIISEIFSDGKGDFFAGKNLVSSLLQQGHHIEWLIAPFSMDAQSIAFFYSQVKALRENDHFTFKALSPNKLERLIDYNSSLLAERDVVVLFPNIPRNFDFTTYQKLVAEKVKLIIMYEYGIDEEWIFSPLQSNYLTEYHELFRKLQLPILFTGITDPSHRILDSNIGYQSAVEWPSEAMQPSGNESLFDMFEVEEPEIETKTMGMFKIPATEIQALSKKTLLDVPPEDRGFIEKLLADAPGQMASEKLDNYNQSHALFFSYTNSELRDDGCLARFFYLCIMYTLEKNPNKTTVDLIGQFHGACVDELRGLLSEFSPQYKIKIRLFNPFPLQHETMLLFFVRAKQDRHLVLVTGDQTLGEVLSLGIGFLYQAMPWKKGIVEQLLKLCHTQGYFKVEAFLTHDLDAIKEICELLADPELYKQFENLHLSIPSLQETFSEVIRCILTEHSSNPIHPLKLEEIQEPESLSVPATGSGKKEVTIDIRPKELRKEVKEHQHVLAVTTGQNASIFSIKNSRHTPGEELELPGKEEIVAYLSERP